MSQAKELAAKLRSKNTDTVTDALWTLDARTPLPEEPALSAFVNCISDRRPYVREIATSKAGKWTSEDRIAATLIDQILKERNQDIIFNLIGCMTSIIMHERWGHQVATNKLRAIAVSERGNKQNRVRAIKVLLFANGQIDTKQFASPDFEDIKELKARFQEFLSIQT
jgi:hypothetical protein